MKGFPSVLLGAAALSLAGACVAEAATSDLHTMLVNLPDGSVAQVHYHGDVAPRISVQPAEAMPVAFAMPDPFAQMAMVSAMMDQQANMMMQQAARLQHEALARGSATNPGMAMTSMTNLPQGMHMTYVSTTTDSSGCTRTVSYSSDGSTQAAPRLIEAASDACHAATSGNQPVAAKAETPAAPVSPDRRV